MKNIHIPAKRRPLRLPPDYLSPTPAEGELWKALLWLLAVALVGAPLLWWVVHG